VFVALRYTRTGALSSTRHCPKARRTRDERMAKQSVTSDDDRSCAADQAQPGAFSYEGRDLEAMAFATNYHRSILNVFRPYLGRHVVEIGSGTGAFTRLIVQEPIDRLTAIEPSPEMFPLLERAIAPAGRVQVQALNGCLADGVAELRLQAVSSCVLVNVLEHIEGDLDELLRVKEVLDVGGHVCVFVPALMALYSRFDAVIGHCRRYTKGELESKARQAGFEICYSRYFDLLGVVPWWLRFRLLKADGLSVHAVQTYDRFGVPLMKLLDRAHGPPIGKNVIMVARRVT